jgi:hypothetical protein
MTAQQGHPFLRPTIATPGQWPLRLTVPAIPASNRLTLAFSRHQRHEGTASNRRALGMTSPCTRNCNECGEGRSKVPALQGFFELSPILFKSSAAGAGQAE